jgi:peroxiredoxin
MMKSFCVDDLYQLPPNLPVPEDDGAAAHLEGLRIPSIALKATTGGAVDLSRVPGRVVVFAFPRTGRPNQPPLAPDWDMIPGARGCTPQTCRFRDLAADFARLNTRIYGLSTQRPGYQKEMAERLHLHFPVLSDAELALMQAMRLPNMEVSGHVLLKRLAWVAESGVIRKIFYPVFPPDKNADEVLAWLKNAAPAPVARPTSTQRN